MQDVAISGGAAQRLTCWLQSFFAVISNVHPQIPLLHISLDQLLAATIALADST